MTRTCRYRAFSATWALMAAAFALPAGLRAIISCSGSAPSEWRPWRHVFAVVGAIVAGSTAWARFIAHRFREARACCWIRPAAKLTPRRQSLGSASLAIETSRVRACRCPVEYRSRPVPDWAVGLRPGRPAPTARSADLRHATKLSPPSTTWACSKPENGSGVPRSHAHRGSIAEINANS